MTFSRNTSARWHSEVPGSRWFKADLHLHTIDDLAGGKARMPAGVAGDATDPIVLREYARVFLRAAIQAGVQVLGLTPHSTRVGDGPETSAIWHIVDMWNAGDDDDGTPFREKIYAVFPGFEPNVNDGGTGVHLLFLFDPEIGRDRFLPLFEAVMNGRAPWHEGDLRLTDRSAKEICDTIESRRKDVRQEGPAWDYLILAPHFQNHHGLLKEVQKQVLETFPCERLAGYELGDEKLPDDFDEARNPGRFLLPFMRTHRQAFFHGSDGYTLQSGTTPSGGELGYRTTWVKLASPRIEALRQAFIASESRLRIAYERDQAGALVPLPEPPDPLAGSRPWLRRVTVKGGAAFFGGRNVDRPRQVTFDFSPDLTCLIGGSMTGKSTLLDGLRVHIGAELPSDKRLREDVEVRGRDRFLAGQPEVELDTPGRPAGRPNERWPAVFFSQNELQQLARDPGVEDLLVRLAPARRNDVVARDNRLAELDSELSAGARMLADLLDQRAEAEQKLAAAHEARTALNAFQEAGLARMQASERLKGSIEGLSGRAGELRQQITAVRETLRDATIDAQVETDVRALLERFDEPRINDSVQSLHARAAQTTGEAEVAISRLATELDRILNTARRAVAADRSAVEKKLAEMGHGAERLAEFQALSRRAGLLSSYQAAHEELDSKVTRAQNGFERALEEREGLVDAQRLEFDGVKAEVEARFQNRIRVRRIESGRSDDLERFLQSFRQKGITQWWNSLDPVRRPSPAHLFEKLDTGRLEELGVSPTVEERFREVFTEARRYELRAIRSPDRYVLELRVGHSEYRETSELSGGRRVSTLLSLLLEAHDDRPLVIDQPEDELDNRFLWETVLPALRRLKGRRQVIVATHNANIVVNGDADLVIQLEADAQHGRVAVSGAIEDTAVRNAIIETVDGGEKAFELRKAKYGF